MTAALISLNAGCGRRDRASEFNPSLVERTKFRLVLYFDLTRDSPTAALAVDSPDEGASTNTQTVVLPFQSENIGGNVNLLATSGSYGRSTIISYVPPRSSSAPELVAMTPIFDPIPDGIAGTARLPGRLYFVQQGLERRFIFRYPTVAMASDDTDRVRTLATADVEAIGIGLPENSTGREIRQGRTAIPDQLVETRFARLYPASDGSVESLEVAYVVPPTRGQTLILEYGLKLLSTVLIPLIGLWFLGAEDTLRPRSRKGLLWGGGAVQAIILVIIGWVAFTVQGNAQVTTSLDLAVLMIGAALAAAVLWIKRKRDG